MEGVSGIGSGVHLRPEDDESTTSIVERDAKVTINGYDKRFAQVKEHCQEHVDTFGVGSVGHAAFEGAEISQIPQVEHALEATPGKGAGGPIGGAVVGLWLGIHELLEAHAKGDAQNAAVRKDYAHVAVIGALNLPGGYKAQRLEKDYGHVSRDFQKSDAFKMTDSLMKDTRGCALLQLHADRGMHAAADLIASKMTVEDFLKANPKVAAQYQKDPAFKEGFDAYLWTEACGTAKDRAEMKAGLKDRDAWNSADHVAIRV